MGLREYVYLFEDVWRWFDNLAAKSYLTATVYLRNLGFYCEVNGTSPKALLKVAGPKRSGMVLLILFGGWRGRARRDPILPGSRRLCIRGSATMA